MMKVGFFIIAPHIFQDEFSLIPRGAAVDHLIAAAREMNVAIEWIGPLPLTRLQKMLSDGELDASLMINKNKERETYLFFPAREITAVQSIFMLRVESSVAKITSVHDIQDFRVGFISAANETPFFHANKKNFHVEYVSGSGWNEQNIQKLLNNRIDAIYDLNEFSLLFQATVMRVRERVKVLPLPELPGKVYVVFSKKSLYGALFFKKYDALRLSYDYREKIIREFSYLAF